MPLNKLREKAGRYWPWIENGFWVILFLAAYITMMKLMHPGFTFFGI